MKTILHAKAWTWRMLRLRAWWGPFLLILLILTGLSSRMLAQPTKQWDKTLGGNSIDELYSLQQTSDDGYILGGRSISGISGDKTGTTKGVYDYWVVKLNASGTKIWDKTFGGNYGKRNSRNTIGPDIFIDLEHEDGRFKDLTAL